MAYHLRRNIGLSLKFFGAILGQQKYEKLRYISRLGEVFSRTLPRQCPICLYRGFFLSFGHHNRPEALCPQCGSLERQRLLYLAIMQNERCTLTGKNVLHFAPEQGIRDLAFRVANIYLAADLSNEGAQIDITDNLDLVTDITAIGLSNNAVDIVICSHVLDQVPDDAAALKELFRILRPQGAAIFNVPIVEGWECTFEDRNIRSPGDRLKHFGFEERVRIYGRDFCTRLEKAGFAIEIFQPHFHAYAEYGLIPGDKIFIGHKI